MPLLRIRDERFQSARDFGDALASYLFHHQMKVTSYDIANLVKETLDRHAQHLSPQRAIIDKMIQDELLTFTSLDGPPDVGFERSGIEGRFRSHWKAQNHSIHPFLKTPRAGFQATPRSKMP